MEILEQLGNKVQKAVKKIEELQTRIKELEEINAQYEAKMNELVQVMEPLDDEEKTETETSTEEKSYTSSSHSESSQDIYRQQY